MIDDREDPRRPGGASYPRVTSTEQWARATTADETLPIRNRSSLPLPLAPRKMQSAPQFSATLTRTSFGTPSSMTDSAFNPTSLSRATAPSTAALTLAFSSMNQWMIGPDASGGLRGGTVHDALTTRASLPFGHSRAAAERTAISAPFDPSTPTINRTGAPGSLTRPRQTRTEQCASCDNF